MCQVIGGGGGGGETLKSGIKQVGKGQIFTVERWYQKIW